MKPTPECNVKINIHIIMDLNRAERSVEKHSIKCSASGSFQANSAGHQADYDSIFYTGECSFLQDKVKFRQEN